MSGCLSSSRRFCRSDFSHLSLLSLSSSLSSAASQTVQQNCYSQVIILFVRLHSAVNPQGIPLYSLLTLLQSSFSCQSQNTAEGEKRHKDKDKQRGEEGERHGGLRHGDIKYWSRNAKIQLNTWNNRNIGREGVNRKGKIKDFQKRFCKG